MDLTTIEKPFGLLDEATQDALRKAFKDGAVIEAYSCGGWQSPDDPEVAFPVWACDGVYRVRPTPKPPAIELRWDVIDPRWKWVAMDGDKTVHLYTHEIEATKTHWVLIEEGDYRQIDDLFTGIRINVTDWRESLTRRPE